VSQVVERDTVSPGAPTATISADDTNRTIKVNVVGEAQSTAKLTGSQTQNNVILGSDGSSTTVAVNPDQYQYSTTYTWQVTLTDQAGNVSQPTTVSYTTLAPPTRTSVCTASIAGKISYPFAVDHKIDQLFSSAHDGIDFKADTGTEVLAATSGQIVTQTTDQYGALYIDVLNTQLNIITRYVHLSKFALGSGVGTTVQQGEVIGYSGNTGKSTGPHLHFGVLNATTNVAIDPLTLLQNCNLPGTTSPDTSLSIADQQFLEQAKYDIEQLYAKYNSNSQYVFADSSAIGTLILGTGGISLGGDGIAAGTLAAIGGCFASVVCGAAAVVGTVVAVGGTYIIYRYSDLADNPATTIPHIIAIPAKPTDQSQKPTLYVTYKLSTLNGWKYFGRTSGTCNDGENQAACASRLAENRFNTHYRLQDLGFKENLIQVDQSAFGDIGKAAIRGREQELIDVYCTKGTVELSQDLCANRIRGVAKKNQRGYSYFLAANAEFNDSLSIQAKYTGILAGDLQSMIDTTFDNNNTDVNDGIDISLPNI
jgi:murein DD-endopeptidase MepM/ murein hydrolase activator NlpD